MKIKTLNSIEDWEEYCKHFHDIECNQKYGDMPYSFHLTGVYKIGYHFRSYLRSTKEWSKVGCAIWGHDLLGDTSLTYNDIVEKLTPVSGRNFATNVADIIYRVTDNKGRNREERKNQEYYSTMAENKLAIYVKLCDIAFNLYYNSIFDPERKNIYIKDFKEIATDECFEYDYPEFRELLNYIKKVI